MPRQLPYYALVLGLSLAAFSAGCGKSDTSVPSAPTADQAQAQQQSGVQAAAAAKAQGAAAAKAAAAKAQAGATH